MKTSLIIPDHILNRANALKLPPSAICQRIVDTSTKAALERACAASGLIGPPRLDVRGLPAIPEYAARIAGGIGRALSR